jgi:YidC/Oxa1 family membrane protein insertase
MEVLKGLANFTASGGLAIILMTIIIKLILLPLSLKQTASMKAMQALQPEIQALKKRVKDRERLTQETMKLYKERGVNPMSGCVPMIPTMIVLVGLYGALIQLAQCDPAREASLQCDPAFQQPFLWVPRLDHPDVFPMPGLEFALPGILPILMAVTQYFSSKMMVMPTTDEQQMMMNRMTTIIMPGMMLFWGVTFPAGLVLYWFVSNVFEMIRLYFMMGPQSLGIGGGHAAAGAAEGLGTQPLQPSAKNGGNGTGEPPAEPDSRTTSDSGTPARSRPARNRQKRGKRSGRR